jgi:sigma-B regulation protein RsbU (phosphoserine phosphatase)
MSQPPTKIWKHLLLLSLGLFVYALILTRTAADIYSLITQPAAGFQFEYDTSDSMIVIEGVDENGPAGLAGIEPGDTLIAVAGEPVRGMADLTQAWQRLRVGEPVQITVRRGEEVLDLTMVPGHLGVVYLRSSLVSILPVSLFAYFLSVLGTFVYLKRINDRSAIVFYLLALAFANAMRNSTSIGAGLAPLLPSWWQYLSLPSWPLAVGLFLHFHLLFPQERKSLRRHPRLILSAVYAPLSLLVPFFVFKNTNPVLAERILDLGWGIWLTVNFCIALVLLGRSRYSTADRVQRKQAQIMFWGAVIGLVPSLTYAFLPELFWRLYLPYREFTLLTLVVWPVAIAYAIVRHRFLDVELIIRKGVVYALLSGFGVGVYLLLVVAVGRLVLWATGTTSQLLTIVATVVIAVAFHPAKNWIQGFVDRRFYRRRFSYREDVRELSRQLVKVLDLEQLLHLLVSHLGETMGIRPVAIFWRDAKGSSFRLRTAFGLEDNPAELPQDDEIGRRLRRTQQLVDVAVLDRNLSLSGRPLSPFWRSLKAEICLPLLEKEELIGVLVLGGKDSGEPYTASDIDLLQTVNDQANIALENALLSEELRERERIKKELEVARRIQVTSLPRKDPEVPGMQVSGISVPAHEVGGDYYDYLLLHEDRFGVVVGDVSGKSTSAALYMAKVQGIVQSLAPILSSPQDLLYRINALAYSGFDRRSFITMVLGIFEPQRRQLTLLRAGHLPVLHYSSVEGRCHRLTPDGLGLGLDQGPIFERKLQPYRTEYHVGDVFVFYTDGVIEATNGNRQFFELEGLESVLKTEVHKDAKGVRDAIVEAVSRHSSNRPLNDDLTVVVIKATEV